MQRIIAMALALGGATSALAQPSAGDPTALVRRLYANELTAPDSADPMWWRYLTGRAAASFAHVLRVEKATGDELVDEDFLCQCQDPSGMRVTSVTITDRTATHATANVRFAFGDHPARQQRMTIELASDGRGWKIAEMINAEGQSFTAENAEALKAYPGK